MARYQIIEQGWPVGPYLIPAGAVLDTADWQMEWGEAAKWPADRWRPPASPKSRWREPPAAETAAPCAPAGPQSRPKRPTVIASSSHLHPRWPSQKIRFDRPVSPHRLCDLGGARPREVRDDFGADRDPARLDAAVALLDGLSSGQIRRRSGVVAACLRGGKDRRSSRRCRLSARAGCLSPRTYSRLVRR